MSFELLKRGYDSNSRIVDSTVEQLGSEIGLKRREQKDALRAILLNLYFSDSKMIGVQRSNKIKLPSYINPFNIGQKAMRTALDHLAPKFITQDIGNHAEGKITTIVLTEELMIYLHVNEWTYNSIDLIENHEPVRLKDSRKILIEYEESEYTSATRQSLNDYMDLLAGTEIVYKEKDDHFQHDHPKVRRSFLRGTFQRGGRIVGPWAPLPKPIRGTILMNGEETVELDFPASTLNILYRIETGAPCPYDEPYPVNIGDINVPKRFCKLLFNISTNVCNASAASNSFNFELKRKDKSKEFENVGVSTREMHHAIKEKHSSIYHHLFKGPDYGAWLQFLESELMFLILDRLTKEKIPSLSVYDSFIVRKSDEEYVSILMNEMADDEIVRIVNKYPYQALEE